MTAHPPLEPVEALAALIAAATPADPGTVEPITRHVALTVAEGICGVCLAPLQVTPNPKARHGREGVCAVCRIAWQPARDLAAEDPYAQSFESLAGYVNDWRDAIGLDRVDWPRPGGPG